MLFAFYSLYYYKHIKFHILEDSGLAFKALIKNSVSKFLIQNSISGMIPQK